MNEITASILSSIDYGSVILITVTVGLGLVALAVLGFIFSRAHDSINGASQEDDEEDDR